ncbi:hypothetical protein PoB_003328100 [Plakobranchus ocellatus]|uniref:Uncharacterized protein n=1 Tax=Plakobranchus ocellatus TaxID=259542 RepID=A0AAV4A6C7_9GAST|nr:hypothetical protein PoB_003328100 [Plakobranchus ocellatus]
MVSDFRFQRPHVSIFTDKEFYTEPTLHLDSEANPGILGSENVDKLAKAALIRASSSGKLTCWFDLNPKEKHTSTPFGNKIAMLRGKQAQQLGRRPQQKR